MDELGSLQSEENIIEWAKAILPAKNTLLENDAGVIGGCVSQPHRANRGRLPPRPSPAPRQLPSLAQTITCAQNSAGSEAGLTLPKELRRRSKSHLLFVRAQPCLICKQAPCDAHHLKFAQPRALGRKVSDEFTVPLCRVHHQDLHRHGNEQAWWANMNKAPLSMAKELWNLSLAGQGLTAPGRSENSSLEIRS